MTLDPRDRAENYQSINGGVIVPAELCAELAPFAPRIARQTDSPRLRALLHAIRSESRAFEARERRVSELGRPCEDISGARARGSSGFVEELTAAEVTGRFVVSERTVTRRASTGTLPGRRLAGRWLFRIDDVEAAGWRRRSTHSRPPTTPPAR